MNILKQLNLALRVLMEVAIIVALGYWGFYTGESIGMKILLGIGAPVMGFGFWSLIDFRNVGSMSEALRLTQELIISFLAALALYITGQIALGWILAFLSLIHHALIYLLGGTILKH